MRTFVADMLLLVLVASSGLLAQKSDQLCISNAFDAHGAIVAGTISKLEKNSSHDVSHVTLAISDSLRDSAAMGSDADVPVDWAPGVPIMGGGPGAWYGIRPEVGKHLLVMFSGNTAKSLPLCVVDMESAGRDGLATVMRMLALDETPADRKIKAMTAALSDTDMAVRYLAIKYLTSPSVRDPQVRRQILKHFAPIASGTHNQRRSEALAFIELAYDPFTLESDVNYRILSFVADRMGDDDPGMRSTAVQFLDSKLSWRGKLRPDPARVQLTHPEVVNRHLQHDIAAHMDHSDQARRLLKLLTENK
jgi:hypothetical protein